MASSPSGRTSASTEPRPAVLVTADAPGSASGRAVLRRELGAERAARLERALWERAVAWGREAGEVWVAGAPDRLPGVSSVPADGADPRARVEHAFAFVASDHGGPVIAIGTRQPRLAERQASAVLDDFRAGVEVVLGPANHGGWYLLAAREPHEALFAVDPGVWEGGPVMEQTLRALVAAELNMGWLTAERVLNTPSDLAALLADPCAPPEVVATLKG